MPQIAQMVLIGAVDAGVAVFGGIDMGVVTAVIAGADFVGDELVASDIGCASTDMAYG